MAQVIFKLLTRAQYDALNSYDAGTLYRVQEVGGGESFYQGTNKLDRNDLDVSDFALASVSEGVVTIKAIKETDGVIAASTDTTKDVTLAKVASTGAAEDISVADAGGLLTATNVEDALAELASASAGGVASKTVYITETSGGNNDPYSKRYGVYQGSTGSTSSPVAAEKLVDIDIPKDMVVEDGSVVDVVFKASDNTLHEGSESGTDVTTEIKGSTTPTSADAGKYIKLTIANAASSHLWIKATDLVDIYTAEQNATQIQLVIDNNNEISATIVAGSVGATELDSTVNASLALANSAVQSVAEGSTNGTVSVDGTDIAVHGLGSAAFTESSAYEEAGAVSTFAATLASIATSGDSEDAAYDNTDSGLTATNVQDAIDEIAGTAGSAVQSVTEGSTDGTISVDGTDVSVHGLGSAAYTAANSYDPSGSAAAVLGTSSDTSSDHTVYGSFSYTDAQIASALEWQTVS